MDQMFVDGIITVNQKHGGLVCLPKNPLLNEDYKLLARIIANRLQPRMSVTLRPSQHCAKEGSTTFEAVAAIGKL